VADWFTSQAGSGSLVLAIPVALVAGLVSFFSPCVIPLLPGYLSYATGLSGTDLAEDASRHRGRLFLGSVLFVLGFSVVFVLIGTASGAAGAWLVTYRRQLSVGLGILSVVLGLVFMGALPLLQRDRRVHRVPAVGLAAAPLLGFLFGLGWTPCISPTLGVISTLSLNEATAARGAVLSGFYSLGLGLPFIVAGVAYERTIGAMRWVRTHQQAVLRLGGVMMIVVGVLLITGLWDQAVSWIQIQLVEYNEVAV